MTVVDSLEDLVASSRELGRPETGYVILGEGNTSLVRDAESFWVKARGSQLRTADATTFVGVRFGPLLDLLDSPQADAATEQRSFDAAVCAGTGRPSTEAVLHALALSLGEARAAAHTHPTALMGILCSPHARRAAEGRLFPDEVLVCGRASAFVPYTQPGLPLARALRTALHEFRAQWGEPPRVVLLENHGLLTLGQDPAETVRITAVCVKAAHALRDTLTMGEPRFLSSEAVEQLAAYRRLRRPT